MSESFDLAVCIGRFQLLHNGQLTLIRRCLAIAPRCLVILGSAHQARSPGNPFIWEERAEMIRLAVPPVDRQRLEFVPLRDLYDMERWADAVRVAVGERSARQDRLALVGHSKDDATSDYLAEFPRWTMVDVGSQGDVHAKNLRAALFSATNVDAALAAIAGQVPASTLAFLRAWIQMPFYEDLRHEWHAIATEQAKWAGSPYPPVFVTVDAVLRVADHVLLIRRGHAPGKGRLALPGGFLEQRESVYQSAVRELEEETGLKLPLSVMKAALKAVRVFDHPDRSQRGRVITHAHYFALAGEQLPAVTGLDDAAEALWVPIAQLASLEEQFHDDHLHILDELLDLTACTITTPRV